jgi:hypothetical protein
MAIFADAELIALKDWKNDPTERDWERQLEDQSDARWHEIHDGIGSGLAGNVNRRRGNLSDVINEYYHLRERAIQDIESANLLPAQVRNEWLRSVGRINLILESTGAQFDALLSQIDDYVDGVKLGQFTDPLPATYVLQNHQIEPIISAIRSLKETYFRFQRELDTP